MAARYFKELDELWAALPDAYGEPDAYGDILTKCEPEIDACVDVIGVNPANALLFAADYWINFKYSCHLEQDNHEFVMPLVFGYISRKLAEKMEELDSGG